MVYNKVKNLYMNNSLRALRLVIYFTTLLLVVNTARSIYSVWQKQSVLGERRAIVDELRQENEVLKHDLSQVESQDFIEKQAREKLNLQKEGDIVVVLPKDLKYKDAPSVDTPDDPNWRKWWKLFF